MVRVSQVRDKYLVVKDDGTTYGPYDKRFQAATKARKLKANKQGTAKRLASKFASGINNAASRAASAGGDRGQIDGESGGPTLPGSDSGDGDAPSLDMFGGGGGGGAELPSFDDAGTDREDSPDLGFLGGGTGSRDAQMPSFEPPADGGETPEMGDLPFGVDTTDDDSDDEYQSPWF